MSHTEPLSDSEKFKNYAMKFNAVRKFNEFSRIVNERNNSKIENCDLVINLKKIIETALEQNDTPPAIELAPSETPYYRARIIKDLFCCKDKGLKFDSTEISSGYNKFESKEPALGIPGHGRNNYSGISYLYLADNKYTACAEMRPQPYSFISIASFRIMKRLNIIDFSKSYSIVDKDTNFSVDYLMYMVSTLFSRRVNNDQEYYATQYISDLIRKYGVDGICYNSAVSKGKNLTIFNCNEKNVSFISSEVVFVDEINYNIYNFNSLEKYGTEMESDSKIKERLAHERKIILKELDRNIREN